MAILQAELIIYLSGGAANSDPNASLGGAISSTAITTDTLNNLWDNVSGDESAAGDTEYRCFYIKNTNGSLNWQTPTFWIDSNTPSGDTAVRIALGTAAIGAQEQSVADESTEPTGVSWSTAVNKASGLALGADIPFGSYKAIWVERVVTSPAGAYNNDTYTVKGEGETAA